MQLSTIACAVFMALLLGPLAGVWARDYAASGVPSVSDRMERARASISSGNWANAQAELEEALRDDPFSADAHNLLAFSLRKQPQANLVRAFVHYREALRLDPAHRGAHEYIGEAYLMDNQPAQARRHLLELERLCGGRACEEYVDLARALAEFERNRLPALPVPAKP